MDTEELFEFTVDACLSGLRELGMTMEDVHYILCRPDEVRYPIQLENTAEWSFRLFYVFKDGRHAMSRIIIRSPECPIGQWTDYGDWAMYHDWSEEAIRNAL